VAGKSSAHDTVLAKSKLDAKERVLPTIEAGLHEYSQGTVTVRYLSPATDAAFDDLSRGLMALP